MMHWRPVNMRTRTNNRPRKPKATLTPRQAAFCSEYLKDLNASAAARRAGFSPRTAGRQCIDLLRKPHIRARVAELQAERNERVRVDSDWILARLVEEMQADAADLFDQRGALRPVNEWPLPWRRGLV